MRLARILAVSTTLWTLLAAGPRPVSAQAPGVIPRVTLKPATGSHPEEFTSIGSVRELSDGRVLVIDQRERRVVVLDFRDGSARDIGRQGKGPNEFTIPAPLHAIAGDSSMMWDGLSRRWLLLDGDRFVVTVPPDDPAVALTQSAFTGADARGRVLARAVRESPNGVSVTGREDSTLLMLVERATGRADTVARTLNRPMRREVQRNAEGRITMSSIMPVGVLTAQEEAVLLRDGTLVVARVDPFRIERRSPTGQWTRGAPITVPPIRVTAREREVFHARNAENYRAAAQNPFPGVMGKPADSDFPEFIPPFAAGYPPVPGPRGEVLLRRFKSAEYPDLHYLVIDRQGRLIGQLDLRPNEQLAGFGANSLYIAWKDEDDLTYLRRHPWP